MKAKINKGKVRLIIYALIVGGLALTGLIFFSISQYQKAKYKSSSVILTGAESQLKILNNSEQTEAVKDKIAWYSDIAEHFTVINNTNANAYKATAIPAYVITTCALISFGLCLKFEDKIKAKEDED